MPKDPWLGVVEFGTETWFSSGNVTFTAANFGMELNGDRNNSTGGTNSGDGGDANSSSEDNGNAATSVGQSRLSYIVPAALLAGALFS